MSSAPRKVLVTGSAGHLGEALVHTLRKDGDTDVVAMDIKPSPGTDIVGSVADRELVARAMQGVDVVYHTATLHKPHVVTHSKQDFIDTNISGTLALLEAAVTNDVQCFVFTSTTSVYGEAMRPTPGEPAVWVNEDLEPLPRNIYGVTKLAAENLCRLIHKQHGLPCIVLRTSRFFMEEDDDPARRERFSDANIKTLEYLNRRVDILDVVDAHLRASEAAEKIGFGRYVVTATTPFHPDDTPLLGKDAAAALKRRVPLTDEALAKLGWRTFDRIGRVYVNEAARRDLGWQPEWDFERVLRAHVAGERPFSALAGRIGKKGYHEETFTDGPYPVE